ncbi:hypothetical protein AGMMS49965_23630 [Bacteroidia bacterium]|nr:hypothetical protein AGMMS49965_23630 [Bacteroidia bacterium]
MKAKVQYNDFVGTAAADIEETYKNLNDVLSECGVDTTRYEGIGINFSGGVSIICIDNKQKTINDEPYIVDIDLGDEFTQEDLFDLFKRFQVILWSKYHEEREINEELTLNEMQEGEI